jgi:CheY-like chemotaxis protein
MRILVVDDDPMAGEMTSAILEDQGFEVVLVENGVEALEHLNLEEDFDIVVSDLNMPVISGIDLFREMIDRRILIPFILLTGDDREETLRLEPRLTGCLMKDEFLAERLPDLIAEVLPGGAP